MHGYSATLQAKLDQRRYVNTVPLSFGAGAQAGLPNLPPVTALAMGQNNQLAMHRNGVFMQRVVTDAFGVDYDPNLLTWGILNHQMI